MRVNVPPPRQSGAVFAKRDISSSASRNGNDVIQAVERQRDVAPGNHRPVCSDREGVSVSRGNRNHTIKILRRRCDFRHDTDCQPTTVPSSLSARLWPLPAAIATTFESPVGGYKQAPHVATVPSLFKAPARTRVLSGHDFATSLGFLATMLLRKIFPAADDRVYRRLNPGALHFRFPPCAVFPSPQRLRRVVVDDLAGLRIHIQRTTNAVGDVPQMTKQSALLSLGNF